jgi:hypothetical protein
MVAKVKSLVRLWPDRRKKEERISSTVSIANIIAHIKRLTAHVGSAHSAALDNSLYRVCDLVRMVVKAKVPQHHAGGKNHGGGVGDVLTLMNATRI